MAKGLFNFSFFLFVSGYDARAVVWSSQQMLVFLLSEFIFCKLLVFFFCCCCWSKDKREVLESLIPLRWAILEILIKSGRKRSQPRSITTSWTESRKWFIYVPGMLLSACSIPRPLATWAYNTKQWIIKTKRDLPDSRLLCWCWKKQLLLSWLSWKTSQSCDLELLCAKYLKCSIGQTHHLQ